MIVTAIRRLGVLMGLIGVLPFAGAVAQTSTSYKLQEASFNSGGNPRGGVTLSSAHFHIKLDAVGDSALQPGLSSASFHVAGGFVSGYPPPPEVTGLRFTSSSTLQWNLEPSVDRYEIYRDTSVPGTFGTCFASDLPAPPAVDASTPATGSVYYYLVTARNRLREEGTKGFTSSGSERSNPLPCP